MRLPRHYQDGLGAIFGPKPKLLKWCPLAPEDVPSKSGLPSLHSLLSCTQTTVFLSVQDILWANDIVIIVRLLSFTQMSRFFSIPVILDWFSFFKKYLLLHIFVWTMITLPALAFELLNVKPYCAALPITCLPALSRCSRAPCCWSLLPRQATARRHGSSGCRISAEHHKRSALRHSMPHARLLHGQALCTKAPFQEGLGQQGRMLLWMRSIPTRAGELHPPLRAWRGTHPWAQCFNFLHKSVSSKETCKP